MHLRRQFEIKKSVPDVEKVTGNLEEELKSYN